MDYQILEKEAFRVVGKPIQVTTQDNEHSRQIAKFWEECNQDGTVEKLRSMGTDENLLGIMMNMNTYMIACKTNLTSCEEGFTFKTIPSSSWAAFPSVGSLPGSIQNLFVRIYHEWVPSTGFEHTASPVLEIYPPGDTSAIDYQCEVWIPIAKK